MSWTEIDGSSTAGAGAPIPWLQCVNVTSAPYNATGNGTTDDSTAIQAAITAAAISKLPVYFPATSNSYKIVTGLTVTSQGTVFLGDGEYSTINNQGTGDAVTVSATYCKFIGINFSGAASSGWAINGSVANNIIVRDCLFSCPKDITLLNSIVARIESNVFGSVLGAGAYVSGSANYAIYTSGCHGSYIAGNRIDGTAGQTNTGGIYVANVGTTIVGNTIESLGVGIDTVGSSTESISNYFESNTTNDILANHVAGPADNLVVKGCSFASTVAVAIELDYATAVDISNNRSNINYTTSFVRVGTSAKSVRIGPLVYPLNDGTAVGAAHAYNVFPITANSFRTAECSMELTGDLTATRTIFRVRAMGGAPSRYRLKYYLKAISTASGAGSSETFGIKSWTAKQASTGVWTTNSAVADEVTERTLNTASALTVGLLDGDNTGGLVQATCTNYSDPNAIAVFVLEVQSMQITPVVNTT